MCVLVCLIRKRFLTLTDVGFGLLIGVPKYFFARFLLLSLETVPAVVAYPMYSVATIVAVTAMGMLLFGEKISRRQRIAIGIILDALVMLNV